MYALLIVLIIIVLVFWNLIGKSKAPGECTLLKPKNPQKPIKVIAFDFDHTILNGHSGQFTTKWDEMALRVSPTFLQLVPVLLKRGYNIAIVTHSDSALYNGIDLSGAGMIRKVLHLAFGFHYPQPHVQMIMDQIFIADAYPPFHPGMPPFKKWHLSQVCKNFKCSMNEIIMYDDDSDIVEDAISMGVIAYKVDPSVGFTSSDWNQAAKINDIYHV